MCTAKSPFSEMLKEEDEYFNYLTLELKEEWTDNKLYFLLENAFS